MSLRVPELPLHEAGPVFAVLLGLVLLAPLVARRVRLPDVVVLVLAGVLVGPSGLGLLVREGTVGTLGSAGLLVLMFLAGLELDLDDFAARRGDAVRFGVLTFSVPLVLGTAGALALGLSTPAAVLLGSCWSSHTLLTYPQFRRAGTAAHPAVVTSVGATIVTDTAALLVLVVVVQAHEAALTPLFVATLVPSAVALVLGCTVLLPRLADRFFAGPGQDGTLRLLFVLTSLFVVASLTELIGVEPIVGAFLAGLALNRSVPNGGVLMERVELLGSTLFVPLFLLATGMLVDLRVLLAPRVLLTGLVFTATAVAGKAAAAWLAARWLGVDRTGAAAMFSLSNAQAAATLAAVVVGLEVGLLDTDLVNAVVLVVLATCVLSSLVAAAVAPRLPTGGRSRALGTTVVAPVVNPRSARGLLTLAAGFARADAGVVVPLVVAPTGSPETTVSARRSLLDEATRVAQSAGAEARPTLRIDATPTDGIAHTVAEVEASLLVLGWQGGAASHAGRVGGAVDQVLDGARVPTLVVHDGAAPPRRVLVVLDGSLVRLRGRPAVLLALRAAAAVGRTARVPVTVVTNAVDDAVAELARELTGARPVHVDGRRATLVAGARPDDLVVLPTVRDQASLRVLTTRVLRAVPEGAGVVLAVAAAARGPAEQDPAVARRRSAGATTA